MNEEDSTNIYRKHLLACLQDLKNNRNFFRKKIRAHWISRLENIVNDDPDRMVERYFDYCDAIRPVDGKFYWKIYRALGDACNEYAYKKQFQDKNELAND